MRHRDSGRRPCNQSIVDIGNCSGDTIDKFARFRLTSVASREVEPPPSANVSPTSNAASPTTQWSTATISLSLVAITLNDARKERRTLHHNGDGTFSVAGRTVDLRDRMVLWKEFQVDP
jgi:hypothetical protein